MIQQELFRDSESLQDNATPHCLSEREVASLKADALRPDYGGKYYKPQVVLILIAEIERLRLTTTERRVI